jgi:hypothetical protein
MGRLNMGWIGALAAWRGRRVGVALTAILVSLVPAASAFGDVEPNDHIYDAEGPVAGGVNVPGTLAPGDWDDYYLVYVQGQQQIHFSFADGSANSYDDCLSAELLDADGNSVAADYTTGASTTQFYVHVHRDGSSSCSGGPGYSFRIDPGAALVGGPGKQPIAATGEPNESPDQAVGPLLPGVWYTGRMETSNDQDWLFFYTQPGTHQLDVRITAPTSRPDWCYPSIHLTDAVGGDLGWGDVQLGTINHIAYTVVGPQRLHLSYAPSDSGCLNSTWMVQVNPADAISQTPPPPSSPSPPVNPAPAPVTPQAPHSKPQPKHHSKPKQCKSAVRSRAQWTHAIASTKRTLKRTHARRARRALVRKLNAERRTLQRARDRVAIYC